LHARQDAFNAPFVDIAGYSTFLFPLDVELAEITILDESHPRFRTVSVDNQEAVRHAA
jgi:hypothetical protein